MSNAESGLESINKDHFDPAVLGNYEVWWRDQELLLKDRGYILRPRYRLDWVPSWKENRKLWSRCEDGQCSLSSRSLDAIRVSDRKLVGLKKVKKSDYPFEVDIHTFLSSLMSNPDNHCLPLHEAIDHPSELGTTILVMPYLRKYNSPPFDTIGESVEFFRQAFKGLQFMHSHGVAHRDAHRQNIMYDATPLYPEGYHPHPLYHDRKPDFTGRAKHYTRTRCPPKYYWIDFGLSRKYDSDSPMPPSEPRIWGGDRSVPEFIDYKGPCNPFATDIYYVGNLVKTEFLDKKQGFSFMQPLISDMVLNDPEKRPTMDEVVARFDKIRSSLSKSTLRSRVVSKNEPGLATIYRGPVHLIRTTGYILTGTPPIPVA